MNKFELSMEKYGIPYMFLSWERQNAIMMIIENGESKWK